MAEYYGHSFKTFYLAHHGVLGQKWGVRRYQNSDGSLTSEGRKHRGLSEYSIKNVPQNLKRYTTKASDKIKAVVKNKTDQTKSKVVAKVTGKVQTKQGVTRTNYSKKQLANLTDAELNNVLKRLQMESKYQNYSSKTTKDIKSTPKDSKKLELGKTMVGRGLSFLGQTVTTSLAKKISKKIDKWINPQEKKKNPINGASSLSDLQKQYKKDPTKLNSQSLGILKTVDAGRDQINSVFGWYNNSKKDDYDNYLLGMWLNQSSNDKIKSGMIDGLIYDQEHPSANSPYFTQGSPYDYEDLFDT